MSVNRHVHKHRVIFEFLSSQDSYGTYQDKDSNGLQRLSDKDSGNSSFLSWAEECFIVIDFSKRETIFDKNPTASKVGRSIDSFDEVFREESFIISSTESGLMKMFTNGTYIPDIHS